MPEESVEKNSITNVTGETPDPYDEWYTRDIQTMLQGLHHRLDKIETAQHEHTQTLRTVMVGWNAFLKNAEAHLKVLFKGTIPAPLLRKLVQTAFKGIEEIERKGE